jgi:hypothetical protein
MTARNTDPVTSKIAAEQFPMGKRQLQVLIAARQRPFSTAAELGSFFQAETGLSSETPHKRLPELERKGLVRRHRARRCRVTGRLAIVWEPTAIALAIEGHKAA